MIVSKPTTDAYASGWDRIFGKKEPAPVEIVPEPPKIDELTKAKAKYDKDLEAIEAQRAADALRALWWEHCRTLPKDQLHTPTFQEWHVQHLQSS
jgi:hypothetical protein